MRFFYTLLLLSSSANASDKDVAISKTQEAILAHPVVKNTIDIQTKRIIKFTDLDEDFAKTLATAVFVSQSSKISTEKFNILKYGIDNGYIRPDFYYNKDGSDMGGMLNYKWSFK